jgi:1-acyl-sn-glycerol-3-phosphate acyltransferase
MKLVWLPINIVQAVLIFSWTAVSGLLGILLRFLGMPQKTVIMFLCRIFWGPVICILAMVRVKLINADRIPRDRSVIFVANHASHFDIVALSRVFPIPLFFIAKQELKKVPVLGQYIAVMGHIFIDRKNRDKAKQSMMLASRSIRAGKSVISFAEGTRTKDGQLQLFKRGAFLIAREGNIPIVPLAISGARKVLPSGSFGLRPGTITIDVGQIMEPESFGDQTAEQLADLARTQVKSMIIG